MADRTCTKCGKVFRYPANLRDHKGRKTPCAPIVERNELPELDREKQNQCHYCGRVFASIPSLHRHMRKSCKIANTEEGMEKLMEHTLQRQNAELAAKVGFLQTQMSEMTGMMRQLVASNGSAVVPAASSQHIGTVNAVTNTRIDASVTVNE